MGGGATTRPPNHEPKQTRETRGGSRNVVGWEGFLQLKIKTTFARSDSFCLQITKLPIPVFDRHCFPIQAFRDFVRRIFRMFRHAFSDFRDSEILPNVFMIREVLIFCNNMLYPKSGIIGFWGSWTRPLGQKIMNMTTLGNFGKCNRNRKKTNPR